MASRQPEQLSEFVVGSYGDGLDPAPPERVEVLARATSAAILEGGGSPSCVLATRVLRDLLLEDRFDAQVVGCSLRAYNPADGPGGTMVLIPVDGMEVPEGAFGGHVVVVVSTHEGRYLVDPTLVQLLRRQQDRDRISVPAGLITRLRDDAWPEGADPEVRAAMSEWQLTYRHDPNLDWTSSEDWDSPHRQAVHDFAARIAETSPDQLLRRNVIHYAIERGVSRVARNKPCPCGSERKAKTCALAPKRLLR